MSCAIFSVVYPGIESFLPEFLCSLTKQTDNKFTLFLINDGLIGIEKFLRDIDLNVRLEEKSGSPSELRKEGIRRLLEEKVDQIIFADADDYFADNRVEISKKFLSDRDIVFNELMLFGEGFSRPLPMLEGTFQDGTRVSRGHIMRGNCLGLSNTAVNTRVIPDSFEAIPDQTIAFDWALFSLCMCSGEHAVFAKGTQTYYRQHSNNTASPKCFSDDQIIKGVRIKRDHYRFMNKFSQDYMGLAEAYEDLWKQIENDINLKQKYCQAVRARAIERPLWWEPIKLLGELTLQAT